jgi:hypothetical protein
MVEQRLMVDSIGWTKIYNEKIGHFASFVVVPHWSQLNLGLLLVLQSLIA